MLFLYRSFPFLFSLLVSASPILICTAILLGTLLILGEPSLPEFGKEKEEEEVTRVISSLKADVLEDATVLVEKNENFFVESFAVKRKDGAEKAIEGENWEKNGVSKIEGGDDLGGCVPLVNEKSREIQFEKRVIEVEREFDDVELEKRREINKEQCGTGEVLADGAAAERCYSPIPNGGDESLQIEDDKIPRDSIELEHDDHLNSKHSSWKWANGDEVEENRDGDEDQDQDYSDSESDEAESASPDASMADIIPMLDELHPLIDVEAPQTAHMSSDRSDANSVGSHNEESSIESHEDIENQRDEGDDDNDNDNDDEEEEEQEGIEDESKSAIKWTEDDQRNLMDLGTLELERNLRLESLIAKRRTCRSIKVMAEKNLIDLDWNDLPCNIPAISTTRRNPFDLPYDSLDEVPGSAPSILLPRHNPFDFSYDLSEEKSDLKGDNSQQHFSAFQHKEPFFRRYDSFNVGPSVLGVPKQERRDCWWTQPYFVPEEFATEETSKRAFHRQLSEVSESKLSSVPDTESVSSAPDEDKKHNEEGGSPEIEIISNVDHASVLVQCGSLSSEGVDSLDNENVERGGAHFDGDEITLRDVVNHCELDSSLSASGGATPVELNTSEILLRMELGEEDYNSRSSLLSLSEVDEKVPDMKGSVNPEQSHGQTDESHISTQTSLDTDFHFTSEVEAENQHRELVLEPRCNPTTTESVVFMQTSFDSDFNLESGVEGDSTYKESVTEPASDHIGDSGISMPASMGPESHFMNGVVYNDQQESALGTSGSHMNNSGILTQTSINSVFYFTSGAMDDNQHEEPVYDSSPQAVDKLLSFSSISSDTQGEKLEIDSPPTLAEVAGKEIKIHTGSTEKDTSSCKELHDGSLKEFSVDENKSISGDAAAFERDVEEAGMRVDDQASNSQNGLNRCMKHKAIDMPPSSSSNGFVKEVLVYNEKGFNDEMDRLQSSSPDAETIVFPYQDVTQKLIPISSSNHVAFAETEHAVHEQHPSVAVEGAVDSKLSSSMSEPLQEPTLGTEHILHLEQDQIPSSTAEVHVDSCHSTGEELESVALGTTQMPSEDLLSANEKQPPVVVVEQVVDVNSCAYSQEIEEAKEFPAIKEGNSVPSPSTDATIDAEYPEDADVKLVTYESERQLAWSDKAVELSLNDHIVFQETSAEYVTEVEIENHVYVPEVLDHETSESAPVQQESLEYQSKADDVDGRDNILDKIVYEDSGQVLEGSDCSGQAHRSLVFEEKMDEDEGEIKEADEQKRSHDNNLLSRDSNMAESESELPVLEVKSVIDIDLAFKQLSEGVDVQEVILPNTLTRHVVVNESRDPQQSGSDLQVVEVRSLDELYYAMKQVQASEIEEPQASSDPIKETVSRTSEVDEISLAKGVQWSADASNVQKGGLAIEDSSSQ